MANVSRGWVLGLVTLVVLPRLCHWDLIWVEEAYPAAAAVQMLIGKIPYRDFFFDKPPLAPVFYLLFGAVDGWPLRLAGSAYVLLCCWLAYRFGASAWGHREGRAAALLLGFFLTFWLPSAIMALAPDLLMLAPHVAAVWMARTGRPIAAGALVGVAMGVHTKGVFVLAACALWGSPMALAVGFLPVVAGGALLLAAAGALGGYLEQVWIWGARYASSPLPGDGWERAVYTTSRWIGFHLPLVIGAAWMLVRDRMADRTRWLLWVVVVFAGLLPGWRFFPRYYFLLLPVAVLAAARGLCLMPRRTVLALAALLLIPLGRFGPRYVQLALDPQHQWADTAMGRDAVQAADLIGRQAKPGDTILVWGYRPEILMRTRLPLGTPWLDSQPLTGVLADRHLSDSRPTTANLANANRRTLEQHRPTFFVDGLSAYNPALAPTAYPELKGWLKQYYHMGATRGCRIYRLRESGRQDHGE